MHCSLQLPLSTDQSITHWHWQRSLHSLVHVKLSGDIHALQAYGAHANRVMVPSAYCDQTRLTLRPVLIRCREYTVAWLTLAPRSMPHWRQMG